MPRARRGRPMAARGQAGRLPADGPPRRCRRSPADPQRPRLDEPVSTDRRRGQRAPLPLLPGRRRGGVLRRRRRGDLRMAAPAGERPHRLPLCLRLCSSSTDATYAASRSRSARPRSRRLAARRQARPAAQRASRPPGDVVFAHACQLGHEGIVSKRRGSRYESGRSSHWFKTKNPNHRPCCACSRRTGMADEPRTFEEVVAATDPALREHGACRALP